MLKEENVLTTPELIAKLFKTYLMYKMGEVNEMKIFDKGILSNQPEEITSDIDFLEVTIVSVNEEGRERR